MSRKPESFDEDGCVEPSAESGRRRGLSGILNSAERAWIRLSERLQFGIFSIYAGAASIVGIEILIVLLGAAAIWPVGIGVLVLLLAGVYTVRERARSRRASKRYKAKDK